MRIVLLSIACVLILNAQGGKKEDTENPLAGNPEALAPAPLMIGMGLASLLFGAFML